MRILILILNVSIFSTLKKAIITENKLLLLLIVIYLPKINKKTIDFTVKVKEK